MRRQATHQQSPSIPQLVSEKRIHGKMKNQRETARSILFFMLGALFMLVTVQTFCSMEEPLPLLQQDRIEVEPKGSVRAVSIRKASTSTEAILLVDPSVQSIYDDIDSQDSHERCARYGWEYKPRDKPRRIFFGSLIADDSMDTVMIHATEAFGIYHTVALVESNLTQSATPRQLQFAEGSEKLAFITSGIFGPSTNVYVDYFFNETLIVDNYTITNPMARERIQRNLIVQRWIESGMQPNDIGIVADIDETFSRDVLRAAQVCDIPQFRPDQDCHLPRLTAETLIFESSPECMQKGRRWIHPDMIIGECIEGIGDPLGHPVAMRQYSGLGMRNKGYGYKGPFDYWRMDNSTGKYPLWNIADIRELNSYVYIHWNETHRDDNRTAYATGFHFHNYFDDLETLRQKYLTYAHPHMNAMSATLSSMHDDIDLVVRCIKNLPNPNRTLVRRFQGGFNDVPGPKPIFLQNETYRLQRHCAVQHMLIEDEKRHGTEYPQEMDAEEGRIMHW